VPTSFCGAAALECGGLAPLWEQGRFRRLVLLAVMSEKRGAAGKLQTCYQINLITLVSRYSSLARWRTMKTLTPVLTILFATAIATSSFAQTPATSTSAVATPGGQPNPQEMMKQMMEMSKLNENHKLLSSMDGSWTYNIKMWMNPDPNAKPQESKGTATRKSVMGGRYVVMDVTGKMQMPDETGQMKEMQFKGMGVEGYDNVKQKFVTSWIDNMGTGIQFSDGTYDPATKTLTYTSEIEMMPGMKMPVREVLKLTDKDHMMLEWFETHGGQEKKTMEIAYSRAGKK
jgi:hypothetical protein